MKLKLFTLLLCTLVFSSSAFATKSAMSVSSSNDFDKSQLLTLKNKSANKVISAVKYIIKQKVHTAVVLLKKAGIDLSDPVEKYLWYAVIGIVGGIVISVLAAVAGIPFVGYLAYLLYLAGVISFWYWVYLKFLA